jgi:hypothetical protein
MRSFGARATLRLLQNHIIRGEGDDIDVGMVLLALALNTQPLGAPKQSEGGSTINYVGSHACLRKKRQTGAGFLTGLTR